MNCQTCTKTIPDNEAGEFWIGDKPVCAICKHLFSVENGKDLQERYEDRVSAGSTDELIIDAIADLLHLARYHNNDPESIALGALAHYRFESKSLPEVINYVNPNQNTLPFMRLPRS